MDMTVQQKRNCNHINLSHGSVRPPVIITEVLCLLVLSLLKSNSKFIKNKNDFRI